MEITENKIVMRRPDNWHHHFRDDFRLEMLIIFLLEQFARAVAMPNLPDPVRTGRQAMDYKELILSHARSLGYPEFEPVMTIYLTEDTTPRMIREAFETGVMAAKIYPKGGTTRSEHGIYDFDSAGFHACLDEMELIGMHCLIHAEVPDKNVDPQEREQKFMPILRKLHDRHQKLDIVVEHISSREGVKTVLDCSEMVGASVTAHHLFLTKDDLGDPHHCCMPRAKSTDDRDAIREAVLAGNPKFFYGGDDAPHHRKTKEGVKNPAHGVWCGPTTIPLLVEFFRSFGMVERVEPFTSEFGAAKYGFPRNTGSLILVKDPWEVQENYHDVVPFRRGEIMEYRVLSKHDREYAYLMGNLMMGPE